jgi:ABC-type antimicrobial peptide transport system permease subunit
VRNAKSGDVRDESEKLAYLPLAQAPVFSGSVAARVSGDPVLAAAAVRRVLHSIEPNLPIRWTTTLAGEVSDSLVSERAVAQLAGFFAVLALALSMIGLYGAVSFAVARRTNEIGIRMALGAERSWVLGMILNDALLLVATGAAIGGPLAIGAGVALRSMLYGMGSFDLASSLAAIGLLSVAAMVAGYLPARRAASIDPVTALRHE